MKQRLAICLAGLVLIVHPASAAPFLVGTWYGEGQPEDKHEMWMARMAADGTFSAQFRSCIKGKAEDSSQSGQWSLAGDIETISIITVNGLFYPATDSYKILWQNGKKQTYRYLGTGYVYTSTRVDDKFQLPSCEAVS